MKATIMWDYEQIMGMMSLKETGLSPYEYKNWEGPLDVYEEDGDSYKKVNYTSYNVLSTTGYVFRKFIRNYAGQDRTDGDFNWPVIRLADVFLMYAEGQRVFDLRRWRRLENVYGGPGSTGYTWYDVFGAQENQYWVNSPILQYQQCYIFQIPESERNKNSNLTQNKPWR